MAWSKVNSKTKKTFKWWFHKILCELSWLIRKYDNYKGYYFHLDRLCYEGFNIYGEKINYESYKKAGIFDVARIAKAFKINGFIKGSTFIDECVCNDVMNQSPGSYCKVCDAVSGYEYPCVNCGKALNSKVELKNPEYLRCADCSTKYFMKK